MTQVTFQNASGKLARVQGQVVYAGMIVQIYGQLYRVEECRPRGIGFRVYARNAEGKIIEFKTKELTLPGQESRITSTLDEEGQAMIYASADDWAKACDGAGFFRTGNPAGEIIAVNSDGITVGVSREDPPYHFIFSALLQAAAAAQFVDAPIVPEVEDANAATPPSEQPRINLWFGCRDLVDFRYVSNLVFGVYPKWLNLNDDLQLVKESESFRICYDPEEGLVAYPLASTARRDLLTHLRAVKCIREVAETSATDIRLEISKPSDALQITEEDVETTIIATQNSDDRLDTLSSGVELSRVTRPKSAKKMGLKDCGDSVAVFLRAADSAERLYELLQSVNFPNMEEIRDGYQAKKMTFGLIKMNFGIRLRSLVKAGTVTLPL